MSNKQLYTRYNKLHTEIARYMKVLDASYGTPVYCVLCEMRSLDKYYTGYKYGFLCLFLRIRPHSQDPRYKDPDFFARHYTSYITKFFR